VMVAVGPAALKATHAVSTTIPIVAIDFESDPVASGYVASLGRPRGNVTGTFLDHADIAGKWLQFLREAVPTLTRIAAVWDATTPADQLHAVTKAAKALDMQLSPLRGSDASGLRQRLCRRDEEPCSGCNHLVFTARIVEWPKARAALERRTPTRNFNVPRNNDGWVSHVVRAEPLRWVAPSRVVRWPDSSGRESGRSADRTPESVRADHQPQDREGARPHDPALAATASGSGARVKLRATHEM
jgi:hypothetical protein